MIPNHFVLYLQSDDQVHIHWKGAAEIVLASCTSYVDATGQLEAMDDTKVQECITVFLVIVNGMVSVTTFIFFFFPQLGFNLDVVSKSWK